MARSRGGIAAGTLSIAVDDETTVELLPIESLAYAKEQSRFFRDIPKLPGVTTGSLLHVVAAADSTVTYNKATVWPLHVRLDGQSEPHPVVARGRLIELKRAIILTLPLRECH